MKRRGLIGKGTIKRIHVSQVNIRANLRRRRMRESAAFMTVDEAFGEDAPVFTVQTSRGPIHGTAVEVRGPSRLVYRPDRPLSCGARVWIETKAEVEVTDADR